MCDRAAVRMLNTHGCTGLHRSFTGAASGDLYNICYCIHYTVNFKSIISYCYEQNEMS